MADRPCLHALADRVGILPEYTGVDGVVRRTSDESRVMLLDVMGFHAGSEEAAAASLRKWDEREAGRLMPSVRVVAEGTGSLGVPMTIPAEFAASPVELSLRLLAEDGREQAVQGRWQPEAGPQVTTRFSQTPPPGYHRLEVALRSSRHQRSAWQRLIVVPPRCCTVADTLGDRRVFGVVANLYSVRSRRNWGIGDFSDLRELCRWTGRCGGAFIGLNPLHALRNQGGDISPYSPTTRLFRNIIYVDPAAAPEFATCSRQTRESLELEMLRCAQHDDPGPCAQHDDPGPCAQHDDLGLSKEHPARWQRESATSVGRLGQADPVRYEEIAAAKLRVMRVVAMSVVAGRGCAGGVES